MTKLPVVTAILALPKSLFDYPVFRECPAPATDVMDLYQNVLLVEFRKDEHCWKQWVACGDNAGAFQPSPARSLAEYLSFYEFRRQPPPQWPCIPTNAVVLYGLGARWRTAVVEIALTDIASYADFNPSNTPSQAGHTLWKQFYKSYLSAPLSERLKMAEAAAPANGDVSLEKAYCTHVLNDLEEEKSESVREFTSAMWKRLQNPPHLKRPHNNPPSRQRTRPAPAPPNAPAHPSSRHQHQGGPMHQPDHHLMRPDVPAPMHVADPPIPMGQPQHRLHHDPFMREEDQDTHMHHDLRGQGDHMPLDPAMHAPSDNLPLHPHITEPLGHPLPSPNCSLFEIPGLSVPEPPQSADICWNGEIEDLGELGTQDYRSMDEKAITALLSKTDALPGTSAEVPIRWHQKLFVAFALLRLFQSQRAKPWGAIFLLDDPGLGKTRAALALLAALRAEIGRQRNTSVPITPMLGELSLLPNYAE